MNGDWGHASHAVRGKAVIGDWLIGYWGRFAPVIGDSLFFRHWDFPPEADRLSFVIRHSSFFGEGCPIVELRGYDYEMDYTSSENLCVSPYPLCLCVNAFISAFGNK